MVMDNIIIVVIINLLCYLFHLQMERMILKSMDHVVKVFGHIATLPKLNFKLYFIGSKCISTPSVDDICDQYCSVLNLVSIIKKTYFIAYVKIFVGKNIFNLN